MAENEAFIVAIAGVPGSGKSTLLQLLTRDRSAAHAVHYDRFDPGLTDAEICDWVARGGDPNELGLQALTEELARLKQMRAGAAPPLIFFETAFGRLHRASGAFIDFLVWINTPLDIALSRASLVFLSSARQTQASDFNAWMTRYMQDYPLLHRMYVALNDKMAATADLILDGTRPTEVLAASVKQALAQRMTRP